MFKNPRAFHPGMFGVVTTVRVVSPEKEGVITVEFCAPYPGTSKRRFKMLVSDLIHDGNPEPFSRRETNG